MKKLIHCLILFLVLLYIQVSAQAQAVAEDHASTVKSGIAAGKSSNKGSAVQDDAVVNSHSTPSDRGTSASPGSSDALSRQQTDKQDSTAEQFEELFGKTIKPTIPKPTCLISGSCSLQYELRRSYDESDQDLNGQLQLAIDHLVPEHLHFNLLGGFVADIEGHQERLSLPPANFRDIYDSYDTRTQGRLYYAYFTLENLAQTASVIRIGRQARYLDLNYYFDGLSAEVQLHPMLKVVGFGGLSVYDFKGPREDDWLVGSGVELCPHKTTRLSLYYLHLNEDARQEGFNDDIYLLRIQQRLFQHLQLVATGSLLAERVRDVDLRAIYYLPSIDLQAQARVHLLINRIERVTMTQDPFTRCMYAEQPYQQIDVSVSKGLGEHFSLTTGYSGRKLNHDRHRAAFNREFDRFYLSGNMENLPWPGLSVSLGGECWLSEGGGDNDFYGVDAEVTYRFNDRLQLSIGTDYSLYKYDYYTREGTEKTDVYTTYTRLRCRFSQALELNANYEWETYEGEDFHRLTVKVILHF